MWVSLTYRAGYLTRGGVRARLTLLLAVTLSWSGIIQAGEALRLQDAIGRALADNPKLALSGYERRIEEGRVRQAGLRPRVGLDLEVENFLGTDLYDGFDNSETTLSLIWALERGKRKLRREVAVAGLDAAQIEADLRRVEVAADTADAFLEVLRDQERLALAQTGVVLAEQTRDAVAERVRVARSAQIDLDRAEADLIWRQLDEEDASHELLVSRRVLASRWGAGAPDFERVAGDISRHPEPGSYADLLAELSAAPQINRFLTRSRVRAAELHLAETESRQNLYLKTGARYLGLTDDVAFVAGFSMLIGRSNPNQGRIDSARAEAGRADAELVATRLEIETTLFRLHEALDHNLHRAEAIRMEVMPRLESAVAASETAYAAGRYSYQELRQAQATLLQARQVYLEENYEGQANRIAIERLTGTAVGRPAEQEVSR